MLLLDKCWSMAVSEITHYRLHSEFAFLWFCPNFSTLFTKLILSHNALWKAGCNKKTIMHCTGWHKNRWEGKRELSDVKTKFCHVWRNNEKNWKKKQTVNIVIILFMLHMLMWGFKTSALDCQCPSGCKHFMQTSTAKRIKVIFLVPSDLSPCRLTSELAEAHNVFWRSCGKIWEL